MTRHLVVGAGPVGSEVAQLLASQGHEVVMVTRSGSGPAHPAITRVARDASDVDGLVAAAPSAVALYNCANPPYHRWAQEWPPMASAFLTYAERTGAVLATCSNLYGYGPVNGSITESLPLAATGTKGSVRAQMWLDAKAAYEAGRIRATEVRGSDYIVANEQSLIGSSRVVPRILHGKKVSVLGNPDAPHTWTSPGDVARLLTVVAQDERAWGRAWHVPSNPPRTTREVVNDLADAAGVPHVAVTAVPPGIQRLLGLMSPAIRELQETAHQRERAFVLDDSAAHDTFSLTPTPWPKILESVISAYRS